MHKIVPIFIFFLLSVYALASSNRVIEATAIRNGSVTYTLPTIQGGASTVLTNNGSGTLSWVSPASGISTVGTIDSQTASSNGLVISGSSIYAQTASGSTTGLVNTSSQTFGGTKTFSTVNSSGTYQIGGNDVLQIQSTGVTRLGINAGSGNSANYNTALGIGTLSDSPSGGLNTAVGAFALQHITSGANHTSIGVNSCTNLTTEVSDVCIGFQSNISGGASNALALGANAIAGASNVINFGDMNVNVGIANVNSSIPTARLHIPAGTATASSAPLKFVSGTNLTTPEDGAIEYDGTHFYMTDSAPKRRTIMGSLGTNTAFVSAEVGVTGTVSAESGDWISGNCALASSVFTCTLISGVFSATPKCVATINGTTSGEITVAPASATSVLVYTFIGTSGLAGDRAFTLMCHGAN